MTPFKLVLQIRALHSHGLSSIETRGVNREQINFEAVQCSISSKCSLCCKQAEEI